VEHWKQFFKDHKSYYKVGRVSHPPIDPMNPLPPHCDPKKDAEQKARWGTALPLVRPPAGPDGPAAKGEAEEIDDLESSMTSGAKTHEEL